MWSILKDMKGKNYYIIGERMTIMENDNIIKKDNISTTLKDGNVLSNFIDNAVSENESLLNVYENAIKDKLKTVINQHTISGAVVGILPTMGIATTLNLIVMYHRLSKVIDLPIMKYLDNLLKPTMNSIYKAFVARAMFLGVIKLFVSTMELTGIGIPIGVITGLGAGSILSYKAGAHFANGIKDFVYNNETITINGVQSATTVEGQQSVMQSNSSQLLHDTHWTCSCGKINDGNFCKYCGAKKQ